MKPQEEKNEEERTKVSCYLLVLVVLLFEAAISEEVLQSDSLDYV